MVMVNTNVPNLENLVVTKPLIAVHYQAINALVFA